jgi:hypothetical protein
MYDTGGKRMKRLIAVLTILAFAGTWAVVPMAAAQQPDPMRWGGESDDPGHPGGMEGSFITGNGQFQWLMIGAPRGCIDDTANCPTNSAHLWFYNEACNRLIDKAGHLTENDVKVFPLHDPTFLTAPRVGNVLVAAESNWTGHAQPVIATNPLIGQMFYVDVNRGIGRLEELATLSTTDYGWNPYAGAHALLFAPPDDGVFFFDTLLVRCPVGASVTAQGTVFGTAGTLGGDMIELVSQYNGNVIGDGYSSADSGADTAAVVGNSSSTDPSGVFAKALSAFVYDLDEEFIESVDNLPCRCIGVTAPGASGFTPEVRLRDLSGFAGGNESYWEIESFNSTGLDDGFTAALNVRLAIGSLLNVNFFHRLHKTPGKDGLEP